MNCWNLQTKKEKKQLYGFKFKKRAIGVITKELGKFHPFLWVHTHNGLQEIAIIRLKADFLGVENNLVELSCLSKTSYHLVGGVSAQVNGECKSEIVLFDNITEFLAAFKLFVWKCLDKEVDL